MVNILEDRVTIIRLPMVWGKNSKRFKDLLKLIDDGGSITMYPDLFINTISDLMVAIYIEHVILNNISGILHIGAKDEISHKAFYAELMAGITKKEINLVEYSSESGFFSLHSIRREEFLEKSIITNSDIINYCSNHS